MHSNTAKKDYRGHDALGFVNGLPSCLRKATVAAEENAYGEESRNTDRNRGLGV